jgi:hypothetical protein
VTCAGCHVRAHERFGPPSPVAAAAPHGGFTGRDEFQSSAFCSPCHDFPPGTGALEGKAFQETTAEWRRTDFAAEGRTCQSCHMPGGRHFWKGIHDPDFVKDALDVEAQVRDPGGILSPVRAEIVVANRGAGHRLPTYASPQITLFIEQLDDAGQAILETRREAAIARYLTPDLAIEVFDTRLLPGERYAMPYAVRRARDAKAIEARVEVWPDESYRRFYEIMLAHALPQAEGTDLLRQALDRSRASRYTAWTKRIELP